MRQLNYRQSRLVILSHLIIRRHVTQTFESMAGSDSSEEDEPILAPQPSSETLPCAPVCYVNNLQRLVVRLILIVSSNSHCRRRGWTKMLTKSSVSNGRPASLLLAFPDTPLRVQGRLMPPAREHSHYRTFVEQHLCQEPFPDRICSTEETVQIHRNRAPQCHALCLR